MNAMKMEECVKNKNKSILNFGKVKIPILFASIFSLLTLRLLFEHSAIHNFYFKSYEVDSWRGDVLGARKSYTLNGAFVSLFQEQKGETYGFIKNLLNKNKYDIEKDGFVTNLLKPLLTNRLNGTENFEVAGNYSFSMCEKELLGWKKYEDWFTHKVSICNGFSTVECVTLPEHLPRRAFFCFGSNIIQNIDLEGNPTWNAFCEENFNVGDSMFFEELGPNSPLNKGRFQLVQGYPEMHFGMELEAVPFTYIAVGDCTTGNPGHCIGDPHNFFIVQNLLGFHPQDSQVFFVSGFGTNNYASDSKNEIIPLYEDWQPFLNKFVLVKPSQKTTTTILPYFALSPDAMHGPHWRMFKDSTMKGRRDWDARTAPLKEECQGRSQIIIEILKILKLHFLVNSYSSSSGCVVEELERASTIQVWNFEKKICPHLNSVILWVSREGLRRTVGRENEMLQQLSNTLTNRIIVKAHLGKLTYVQQFSLVAASGIVIGVHGGGLWNAARWMDGLAKQALIEVLPPDSPGSTCPLAKMMGIQYKYIKIPSIEEIEPQKLSELIITALHTPNNDEVDCFAL